MSILFFCKKRQVIPLCKRGFGVFQFIGFKTHVAMSIFEVSNIPQYRYLSHVGIRMDTMPVYCERTVWLKTVLCYNLQYSQSTLCTYNVLKRTLLSYVTVRYNDRIRCGFAQNVFDLGPISRESLNCLLGGLRHKIMQLLAEKVVISIVLKEYHFFEL
jgi:hypothetical protein